MAFTEEDVRRLARLARLELSPAETARCATDLHALLADFERIQSVEVPVVPGHGPGAVPGAVPVAAPLAVPAASPAPPASVSDAAPGPSPLRDDVPRPSLPRELLVRDAPSASHGLFEVPRVVSRDEPAP